MPPDDGRRSSPPVAFLAGPTGEEWRTDTGFWKRLESYARHRVRANAMAEYIKPHAQVDGPERTAHRALLQCGNLQLWRHYYAAGRTSLFKSNLCHKHLLCPLCASLRGLRLASAYHQRVEFLLRGDAALQLQLVTFTVKDGPDLLERFEHLHNSLRILRKRAGRGNAASEWSKVLGAVWSFEVKKGSNSGLWHPHVHALCVVRDPVNKWTLIDQWREITLDSRNVDVADVFAKREGGIPSSFLECFKYALKFSDMTLPDNFDSWRTLRGRHLIANSGILRGIDLDPSLMDPLLDDPKFYDLAFQFFSDRVDASSGEVLADPHYRFLGVLGSSAR